MQRWASWIAWELESAGYRTVLQAWDFVPGTNFIDFMDRGVTEARAVAKPAERPVYPVNAAGDATAAPGGPGPAFDDRGWSGDFRHARRKPAVPPAYPLAHPAGTTARSTLAILHVAGPRFGRGLTEPGAPVGAAALQERIWADVTQLADAGLPQPELLMISGDLTESGSPREFDQAITFVTGLRAALSLEAIRLVLVPGGHDVTRRASEAYFANCEADDVPPRPPY
jgi:TIR domain